MYFEAPPGLQLLHCLENNVKGGESIFLDIFGAVERLKVKYPEAYKTLTTVPVLFHYENDGKYYEYLRPTIQPNINDGYHVFYSPPFQGPLRCDPKHITPFYDAFAKFEQVMNENGNEYQYLMKKGDLALFANRRVLHGRQEFDPTSGYRWFKGTYVGWDEVKDRMRVTL